MARPLVSVVLPTWNGAAFLADAIESCRRQTLTSWELIVVDDASTDTTPAIIDRFVALDERVRAVRHETNRRLPAALNTGFRLAAGSFFTWTSDDNCYRSNALSELVHALEEHPKSDIVYADYTRIDEAGRPERRVRVADWRALAEHNCVGPCFLYRREVHEALGGYREELFLVEDYDFWLRAAAQFRFRRVPQDLYLYRRHSGSLTDRHARRIQQMTLGAIEEALPDLHWLKPASRGRAHLRLARGQRVYGSLVAAWTHLLKAVGSFPPLILDREMAFSAAVVLAGTVCPDRLRRILRPRTPVLPGD